MLLRVDIDHNQNRVLQRCASNTEGMLGKGLRERKEAFKGKDSGPSKISLGPPAINAWR